MSANFARMARHPEMDPHHVSRRYMRYSILREYDGPFGKEWTHRLGWADADFPKIYQAGKIGIKLKYDPNYGEWQMFNVSAVDPPEWTDAQLFYLRWSAMALRLENDFIDCKVNGFEDYDSHEAFMEYCKTLVSEPKTKSARPKVFE